MRPSTSKEKQNKLQKLGALNDTGVLNIYQESTQKYDFTKKSQNYYQPPIPSFLPPLPPVHHHTKPELPRYKPVYELDFTPILL